MGGAQKEDNPFPKEKSCDNAENTGRRPGIDADHPDYIQRRNLCSLHPGPAHYIGGNHFVNRAAKVINTQAPNCIRSLSESLTCPPPQCCLSPAHNAPGDLFALKRPNYALHT